ncbi:MAG: DUF3054 domain-containing protein [Ardenticatenia bacterium]|nr:DUF3054 domain-containing protein [Ardenticatenia bacterium]
MGERPPGTRLTLLIGDTITLFVFAWLGRMSHQKSGLIEVVGTAWPFWVGWWCASVVLGAYRPDASALPPTAALRLVAKTWALGIPLGLLVRALWTRRPIPLSFAVVTLLTTLVLMSLWRTGFAVLRQRTGAPPA